MFGLLYALFMGSACAVDSVKKDIENEKAKEYSKENGGKWALGRNKSYWNGQEANVDGCNTTTSHYVIKDKNGKILKDYTQERFDEHERKDEQQFYKEMYDARSRGDYYFKYDPFFWSNGDFKLTHPIGYYEVDTLKRIHTMTDENGKHYKMYDKITQWYPERKDIKGYIYEADEENKIEISEAEWKQLGGEKNQIISQGRRLFNSPGDKYRYTINHYNVNKKHGR